MLSGDKLSIKKNEPRLIMLHNLSHMDIWITQQTTNQNSALSSLIQSGLWSALATEKEALQLNCIESKPGHEQRIPCLEALAVCEWPLTGQPDRKPGVAWGGENMTLTSITAYLGRHGFIVPTQVQ